MEALGYTFDVKGIRRMNNKKVFSFHMFLQTLKQTRLAGFIMMAVITLISVVPIISSLSYIKEYKQVNNVGGI